MLQVRLCGGKTAPDGGGSLLLRQLTGCPTACRTGALAWLLQTHEGDLRLTAVYIPTNHVYGEQQHAVCSGLHGSLLLHAQPALSAACCAHCLLCPLPALSTACSARQWATSTCLMSGTSSTPTCPCVRVSVSNRWAAGCCTRTSWLHLSA